MIDLRFAWLRLWDKHIVLAGSTRYHWSKTSFTLFALRLDFKRSLVRKPPTGYPSVCHYELDSSLNEVIRSGFWGLVPLARVFRLTRVINIEKQLARPGRRGSSFQAWPAGYHGSPKGCGWLQGSPKGCGLLQGSPKGCGWGWVWLLVGVWFGWAGSGWPGGSGWPAGCGWVWLGASWRETAAQKAAAVAGSDCWQGSGWLGQGAPRAAREAAGRVQGPAHRIDRPAPPVVHGWSHQARLATSANRTWDPAVRKVRNWRSDFLGGSKNRIINI